MSVFNMEILNELKVDGRDPEEVINGEPDTDKEDSFDMEDGDNTPTPEEDSNDEPNTDGEDNFDLEDGEGEPTDDGGEPNTDGEDNFNLEDDEEPADNGDEGEAEPQNDTPDDEPNTDGEDDFNLEDDGEEGGEDTQAAPEGGDEGGEAPANPDEPDTSGDDNFDLDGGGDGGDNTEGGEETGAEGTDDTATDDQGNESDPENEINQLEDEIFSTLSDEQKAIKLLELKTNIAKIHTQADSIIDKINSVPKQIETAQVFNNIIKSLESLKEMSIFYVNNTFDTKTFTENNVIYKKYLVCLKVIQNILDEVQKKQPKEDSKDANEEK